MRYICYISLLVFSSCGVFNSTVISYKADVLPKYVPEKPFEHILMLSTLDIPSKSFRKNKEILFKQIQDSMLVLTAGQFQLNSGCKTTVLPGMTVLPIPADSSIKALLLQHNATHAIVLNTFDIYFSQSTVNVTTSQSGKDRQAYYDIVAAAEYSIYNQNGLIRKTPVKVNRQHSDRQVISGLLAAGPDIVANSNDAVSISRVNVRRYLFDFYPTRTDRSRAIFSTREFAAVGDAIDDFDYEKALAESLKLVSDPDKTKAAKANYNCAVLMERKNEPARARAYLEASLKLRNLPEAVLMMADFEG